MAGDPIIVCDNLVKIYQVWELEVVALQGLDLTVQQGELMGIIGASGSGKSTLMNILGGLMRPTAGRVWVDHNDLFKLSDAALDRYRRTRVGFVWQQGARNLIPYLNTRENVELPMMLAGEKGARKRAERLLELVGLEGRINHRLAQLSGGEQQRVAIAVALANRPSILLADEPTGELDSATAQMIYQAFRDLNRELGLTTLIVSHDPQLHRHVDRVIVIRDGKTVSETMRTGHLQSDSTRDGEATPESAGDEQLEELVILDSAGRLQVPKNYREALNIRNRVRMELTDEGVLLRPVERTSQETPESLSIGENYEGDVAPGWWDRIAGWLNRRGSQEKRPDE